MNTPTLEILKTVCMTQKDIDFLDKYMFKSKSGIFVLSFDEKIPYKELGDQNLFYLIARTKKEIKLVWGNDVFLNYIGGKSFDAILGHSFEKIMEINKVQIEELHAIFFNLYNNHGTEQRASITRADGSKIIVDGQYNLVVDPNYDINGIIGFFQDVTAESQLEDDYRALQERVKVMEREAAKRGIRY